MRKSLFFVVFTLVATFSNIFAVQAADLTATGGIESRDVFETGSVISDNPVLRAGVSASFDNGWCGKVTGAVDLKDTSKNQASATACYSLAFGKAMVSAGVTYFNVYERNAVRPYIEASMPVFSEDMSVFAKMQTYFAENHANNGNVVTVGGSFKHPFIGTRAKHMLSFTDSNTSYAGSREGKKVAYKFSADWKVSKSMKLTPSIWGVDEKGRRPVGGASVNLTYSF